MTASTERSVIDMTLSHVEQIASLESEVFSSPWSESALKECVGRENTMFLVCEEEGAVLGYVGSYVAAGEVSVTNVATRERCRRTGIASALIGELINKSREKGYEKIFLEVRVSNIPAISLYEKFGFKRVGTRRGFYTKPQEDAYVMILEIQKD